MGPIAEAVIALGSNMGDRRASLRRGVALLAPELHVLAVSPLYESDPVGVTDQPPFLNAVLRGETALAPIDLLEKLKRVERDLGRRPGPRWGPRPLDLDILLYDALRLESEQLTIPHPRLRERAFVLQPLADLDGERVLPGGRETVRAALAKVDTGGLRRLAGPEWLSQGPVPSQEGPTPGPGVRPRTPGR